MWPCRFGNGRRPQKTQEQLKLIPTHGSRCYVHHIHGFVVMRNKPVKLTILSEPRPTRSAGSTEQRG